MARFFAVGLLMETQKPTSLRGKYSNAERQHRRSKQLVAETTGTPSPFGDVGQPLGEAQTPSG
jgi:hypothetical protein